jgi:hypothetical protein
VSDPYSEPVPILSPDALLAVFTKKLLEAPTPELTDAYIRLRAALGRDGDYDLLQKRLEALEKRLVFVEGMADVKRLPSMAAGLRLG